MEQTYLPSKHNTTVAQNKRKLGKSASLGPSYKYATGHFTSYTNDPMSGQKTKTLKQPSFKQERENPKTSFVNQ